ncbi:MAG: haloacid dehalogenase-like hydrolase [Draconibacterium sp.]|nr:haloacid dehalogenase-like hydrolase [Draconibacterium sp.]
MKKYLHFIFIISVTLFSCTVPEKAETVDSPLSLWNESSVKTSIITFVESVTDENSSDFVPVKERIAVFDNDGTLWNEKPLYIPIEFEIDYIKSKYNSNPEWEENNLYKGLAEGDLAVMKDYNTFDLISQLFAVHNGQLQQDYFDACHSFLNNNKDRKFNKPFKEMVYSPMVELVHYLHANNFKVFIVTGGEITFLRTVSEEIYNIPMENVIGSNVVLEYKSDEKGDYLVRTGKVNSANDKHIKPTNIELHIGRKPIFAAGNSDGDYEMMEYTLSGNSPSMAILVHHDDKEREYVYMHGTEKAFQDADKNGWHVVSMKSDFKEIFPK